MTESGSDHHHFLATLAEQAPKLSLQTSDIMMLAYLHRRSAVAGAPDFDEEQLVDAFFSVLCVSEPGAEMAALRATAAIARLREQRLLLRVDAAGVLRSGRFALSRLAEAIVDFFTRQEALDSESLAVLTSTLQGLLGNLREAALQDTSPEALNRSVALPLSVSGADLLDGVERRQRGLDQRQEVFQREIGELLRADWFGAVEQCQALLDQVARTLRELNDVLLRDTRPLQEHLAELRDLAADNGADQTLQVVTRTAEQVDRIAAWGTERQRAWSEYYDYVHRYLRDIVRLDPARAISHRLRTLIAEGGRGIALTVAAAPSPTLLRDVAAAGEPPPVRRPKRGDTEVVDTDAPADPMDDLALAVKAELDLGASDLAELTRRLTAEVEPSERFLLAGRIAQVLAQLRRPLGRGERSWQQVDDGLAIEQWAVASSRSGKS